MKLWTAAFTIVPIISFASGLDCHTSGGDTIHCFSEKQRMNLALAEYGKDGACSDDRFLEEAEAEYKMLTSGEPQGGKIILGKKLLGKKKNLEILEKMLSAPGEVAKEAQEAVKSCGTAFCVVEKVLGSSEAAYRAFNISYHSGYTISLNQNFETEHVWSLRELRNLNFSVANLPKDFFNDYLMGWFYSVPKGTQLSFGQRAFARPEKNGKGVIVLGDSIRDHYDRYSIHAMIHEMAHYLDMKIGAISKLNSKDLQEDLSQLRFKSKEDGFAKLNGWKNEPVFKYVDGNMVEVEKWNPSSESSCFATRYASTSPMEDFAESVTAYIMTPNKYREKCPEQYKFLKKKFFNGREYKRPTYEKTIDEFFEAREGILGECVETSVDEASIMETGLDLSAKGKVYQDVIPITISSVCVDALAKYIQNHDQSRGSCSSRELPGGYVKAARDGLEERLIKKLRSELGRIYSKENANKAVAYCRKNASVDIYTCVETYFHEKQMASGLKIAPLSIRGISEHKKK